MSETKIEHITNSSGDRFQITDSDGNHVTLQPDEALLCLQFLYQRVDEIQRLVNGEQGSEIERYNREMDEQNRIIFESRDKPWLPLHDGE